jgi:type 1 glutamine amidotransferase
MNRQQLGKAAVAAALAVCAGSALAQRTSSNPALSTGATAASQESHTYGPCRGLDPTCYHEWGAIGAASSVLIFSRTSGPRDSILGDPLPTGNNPAMNATNVAQAGLKRMLTAAGITSTITENVGNLSNGSAKAIIFLSTSRDVLLDNGRYVTPSLAVSTSTSAYLDASKVNLRQYMRKGGGFVGIHQALGTEYNWFWFQGLLGGANMYDAAPLQEATVQIAAADPSTAVIGPAGTTFKFTDNWYTLVPFPSNVKFLASINDATMAGPVKKDVHPGHGAFRPVAWCHYYSGGRVWMTSMGGDPRAWADLSLPENQIGGANYLPGAAQFQALLVAGIKSAMGLTAFCT